jgi:hypothetical protein
MTRSTVAGSPTAMTAGLLALRRVRALQAAVIAAIPALLLVTLGPPGGDSPAHLYRTLLVREGVYLWDNLWFAGHYPLASYSLLYYLPAALVGNVPLVVAAVLASAILFDSVSRLEWGAAALWPSRLFAVLAAGPLFTGTYAYALGLAALLGTLAALQRGRTWLAIGCAALTLGFNPLAFLFLCIILAAVLLVRGRAGGRPLLFAAGLAAAAGLEATALLLFPTDGRYPFRAVELLTVVTVSALGAALAMRTPGGRVLAAFFAVWALASLIVFFVPDPVGENMTRLRSFVFPLMLLAALLASFRPRVLAACGLALALFYNTYPYVKHATVRVIDTRPAAEEFWAPALAFLRTHASANYRVEVVPTYDHWEAYWVPKAGFALARGWDRQIDMAENGVLYRKPLTAAAYRRWLRLMGVRYVLLPDVPIGNKGADREARLLASGRSGLVEVFAHRNWRIFELPKARPILIGPAPASLLRFGHDRVVGTVREAGTYSLRVRYMPHWQVRRGEVCLERAPDGMTRMLIRRPGRFILTLDRNPAALVANAFAKRRGAC